MGIFDTLSSAAEVLRKADKIDEYKQILEAQRQILDMQKHIAELEESNKELSGKLEIKETLVTENDAYWINSKDKKDGPFCSRCWDVDRYLVRLHPCGNPAYFDCPNCKAGSVKAKPEFDRPINQFHHRESYL